LCGAKESSDDYEATADLNWKTRTFSIEHDLLLGFDYWESISHPDRSFDIDIPPIDVFVPVYGRIPDPSATAPRRVFKSDLDEI
jgi:hypothetical protein